MSLYKITFAGGPIIELGGGDAPVIKPNVDVRKAPNVDIVCDFNKKLPLESDAYNLVFSRFVIEHISHRNVEFFISEIYRIPKHGGRAVIICPNLIAQCKKIIEEGVNKKMVPMLFGGQEFPNNAGVHKCGFSPDYIVQLFKNIGFNLIKVFELPDIQFPHILLKIASATDMMLEARK